MRRFHRGRLHALRIALSIKVAALPEVVLPSSTRPLLGRSSADSPSPRPGEGFQFLLDHLILIHKGPVGTRVVTVHLTVFFVGSAWIVSGVARTGTTSG